LLPRTPGSAPCCCLWGPHLPACAPEAFATLKRVSVGLRYGSGGDPHTSPCLRSPVDSSSPAQRPAERKHQFLLPASGCAESSPSPSAGSRGGCQLSTCCQIPFFLSLQLFVSLFYAILLFHLLSCSFCFPLSPLPFLFLTRFFLIIICCLLNSALCLTEH